MSVATFTETLTDVHFETVTDLASKNFAPSDIALKLQVSKRDFMHVWRDKNSRLREAYERGRLEIAIRKEEALIDLLEDGNVTAYQIHDKKAREQHFEDVKADVFGF